MGMIVRHMPYAINIWGKEENGMKKNLTKKNKATNGTLVAYACSGCNFSCYCKTSSLTASDVHTVTELQYSSLVLEIIH